MRIMDTWEELENVESLKSDLNVPGRGLGKVHPRVLESATWVWRIDTFEGQRQYGKFVEAMMNRIRFEESNLEEIKSFIDLIATDENWNFLRVAQSHIPELRESCLHPNEHKNFQLSLLFQQLKKLVHERTCKFQENKDPLVTKYLNGLSKAEQVFIEQILFGCYAGPNKTPAMRRLLESTLELAFPQKALNQKIAEAKARGTDIERDSVGLPAYLVMPGEAREPGLWRQKPSVTSARAPYLPASKATSSRPYSDGPPSEPLTHIDDANYARASKGKERLRASHDGLPENIIPLKPNIFAALPESIFETMPESSEQQVGNLRLDLSRKARPPGLEYLWNLPATPGRTAPREGPIYPKGMDPNVVPSQPASRSLDEAFPNPASPIKSSITAGEAKKPQATKKGSNLDSSDSKAGHAMAESAQRFNRPPTRKSVQGSSPMVVVKENGALVTYTSPTCRGR